MVSPIENGHVDSSTFFGVIRRTLIRLTGADRASFLHNFSTNDINKLQAGQQCEAFITTVQGKTLGHVVVFCHDDALLLITADGQQETLINHLDRYIIMEDVQLEDSSEQFQCYLLIGEATDLQIGELDAVEQSLPYGYGGDQCLLVLASSDITDDLCRLGVQPATADWIESARIESGFVEFGVDVTDANLPQEVARDSAAICFTKGCYLGQETVARIDALGHVNWLLKTLVGEGLEDVNAGDAILDAEGKTLAKITSCGSTRDSNQLIALAYVHKDCAASGTEIKPGLSVS